MLQLHLVVIQQPPKELVGGGGKSPLVKVSEGHNIAIGRRRRILIAKQPPILGGGPRAKKAAANKALQALEGDIGSAPRLHWVIGVDGCGLNDGCAMGAEGSGNWRQRL